LAEFRNRLVSELALSADQQQKLDALFTETRPKFAAMRDATPEDRPKVRERIMAELRAKVNDFLTPEQKTKYTALQAEMGSRTSSRGRIYLLNEQGKPVAYNVRLGITDGTSTELMVQPNSPNAELFKEGATVITGVSGGAAGAKPGGALMPLIEARELVKTYTMGDQTVHALRGVSLSIAEGEFVAIMGASGSGKSTLMNILGCLDLPTSGEYRLANENVEGMQSDQLASIRNRRIGFVFQQFNLLPRTSALENVELPMVYAGIKSEARKEKAKAALARVGLAERMDHTPAELSGGQQQRVAIARALVNNPQLILADEPTGALDSQTSEDIMKLLTELNQQGMTVVLVTHEHDVAAWARRRIVFRDGLMVEDVVQAAVR
jgi:putative ABC transport system ATP-binding protein